MAEQALLADRLDERATELARRSIDLMYEDPFWESRFGARGRRFALEDGRRHVDYLCLALRTGRSLPLEQYARWLQVVLTTRGMCTRHIAQNFARLGDAIRSLGVAMPEPALAYLASATQALRYEHEAAAALHDAAESLGTRAMRQFRARHAAWAVPGGVSVPGSTDDQLATLVSYLADAIALGRGDGLASHVRWLAGYSADQGRPAGYADALLQAIERALEATVGSDAAREAARSALAPARAALGEVPA